MMRSKIIPFVVALSFFCGAANAATYYVDTNHSSASDGNPGTEALPWKTLQHAADVVGAGDTVLVKNGTYAGFQVETSGTVQSPITFRALGNSVIVNDRNPHTPHNINVEGGDYVIVDGFDVRNAPSRGIRVVVGRGVIVRNCSVRNSATQNILTGYAPEVKIINNVSYGTLDEHGIYVSNSTDPNDRPIIRGNVVYGNNTNGIQVNGDCYAGGDGTITGAVIEDNFVYGNGAKGLSIISMSSSIIRNNVIYHNGTRGIGAGGIHLADEPGCGLPSSHNLVVNNTIVEDEISGIRITQNGTGNVIFNNIAVARRDFTTIIEDGASGNLIDSVSNLEYAYASLPDMFVDEAGGDYHLKLTASNAIDRGVATYQGRNAPNDDFEGTHRPAGAGFDIGADELLAASSAVDFDGDGAPDIFWRDPGTGKNAIWYMQSNGRAIKSSVWAPTAAIGWIVGGIADFDADGVPDVFWRDPGTGKNAIWYMQSSGRSIKSSVWAPTTATGWTVGGIADFDADGVPDVFWRDPGTGKNAIWYMQSSGRSIKSSVWAPSAATGWTVGGIADFDADGVPDVFWRDPGTGKNAIWYMQSNGRSIKSSVWAPTVAAAWIVGKLADFDGDRTPDVFWRDPGTGKNAIWYMQSSGRSIKSSVWAPTAGTTWIIGG